MTVTDTATAVPNSIPKALRAAAEEVERRGWCQGNLVEASGEVCMRGAIVAAVLGAPGYFDDEALGSTTRTRRFVVDVLAYADQYTAGTGPHSLIEEWNDRECNSGDQAAARLRAMADAYETTRGSEPVSR